MKKGQIVKVVETLNKWGREADEREAEKQAQAHIRRRQEEAAPREKAEREWRITPREITDRVRHLRAELESYREQMEGVPFDIPSGDCDTPKCLDFGDRKHTLQLVEELNPFVSGMFEMIDKYAEEHGCHE